MFWTAAGQNSTLSYTASDDMVAKARMPRPATKNAAVRHSGHGSPARRLRRTPYA
jgi:hypothetical protein